MKKSVQHLGLEWINNEPIVSAYNVGTPDLNSFEGIARYLVGTHMRIGWINPATPTEAVDAAVKQLAEAMKKTEEKIIAIGLDPKVGGVYRIGLMPNATSAMHPHIFRPLLRDLLSMKSESWGYINTEYYGEEDEPEEVPLAMAGAPIGTPFFVVGVDGSDAPGHNPKLPWSVCSSMEWSDDRMKAFAEWASGLMEKSGELRIEAMNQMTFGLTLLLDTARWDNAFTRKAGIVDFISQTYDVERDLCPYGSVYGLDEAGWYASDADADSRYAAAAVVW